ncbi:MAG: glycerophosphodiester phosphodiesterase family protein [Desulfobacterales bacterium]|nr:glycerophosphodiester phosphodiesterase family protein [Desulfobacterales bacterium]
MSLPLDGTYDLQGHRGARGKRPENTIPAFQFCLENHMTTIELDTNLTKDHQLIVYHDTVLNCKLCRHENGKPATPVPIKDLTVTELKQLDCGVSPNEDFPEQIPVKGTRLITLAEFFDFVRKSEKDQVRLNPVRFNIETKFRHDYTPSDVSVMAGLMVKTIADAAMTQRSTVQSFVLEVLPQVKRLNEHIQTSALFEPGPVRAFLLKSGFLWGREEIIQKALSVDADIISPHFLYIDRKFIQRCHSFGKKVLPWVVNQEKMMEDFFEWGVDGIISDYPDRLYRVYSRWSEDRNRK